MLTWIEIDTGAIGRNIEAFRSVVSPGTAVMSIVKGNAYGHGIEVVAPVAAQHADWLGVNNLEEALGAWKNEHCIDAGTSRRWSLRWRAVPVPPERADL